jgi:hypothetical protein
MPTLSDADIALMTASWGLAERGREWYNQDSEQFEGFNGGSIIILG